MTELHSNVEARSVVVTPPRLKAPRGPVIPSTIAVTGDMTSLTADDARRLARSLVENAGLAEDWNQRSKPYLEDYLDSLDKDKARPGPPGVARFQG